MIHSQRLSEIRERIQDIDHELDCGFSAEVETRLFNEQNELREEEERLQTEQEDYREGYAAGQEFHMGSGQMREEWQGRFGAFRQGFDAAGQDS